MTFLLDSNVLIYADCEDMAQYGKVAAWLAEAINKTDSIILTETVVL